MAASDGNFNLEFSWMAASQRQQLQIRNSKIFYTYFTHILHFLLWRHVKKEQIFVDFWEVKVSAKSASTQN